ncbi:MAG TPA: hypothetical protein VKT70_12720 [Stellaceae bacterium]|nr:hypothetical protein [Stellaceae bacterium]
MMTLRRWAYLGALTIVALSPLPAGAASNEVVIVHRASMADLEALATAGNWRELGDHLNDIAPAERNAHWEGLVEQSALGELTPLLGTGGGIVAKLEMIDRYYPSYPSLADSDKFLELRGKVGLETFQQCFEFSEDQTTEVKPEACRNALWNFVTLKPLRYDIATPAAHMVAARFAQATAAPFFAVATQAPHGEAACTDAGINDAVVAGLGQEPQGPEAKGARFLLKTCWDKVQAPVVEAFGKESPGSLYMKNACPTLMAHNALQSLRAKRCEGIAAEK